MSKILLTLLPALLLSLIPFKASAATPQEMEQARAIAVKWCLRGMNNGSGYLNSQNPKSLDELEKSLKAKEKANIGKLKAIAMPPQSEYAGWDKEQFDKYWTSTFFNSSAVNFPDKNFCKGKAAAEIKNIKVTKQAAPATQTAAATEEKPEEKPAEQPQEVTQAAEDPTAEVAADIPAAENIEAEESEESEALTEEAAPQKSGNSNTLSIVILIILVVVVAALVVYAMNVMKKNKRQDTPSRQASTRDFAPTERRSDDSRIEESLAEKDAEISRLLAENAQLRRQLKESRAAAESTRFAPKAAQGREPKVIYLAQANSKGVFMRADAKFNMGNSIFKLVTTDGISGSYTVIDDEAVHEMATMMPDDFLVNACDGPEIRYAEKGDEIVNDRPGTAIFEDGRWRVSRKARIHYEAPRS